MSLSSKYPLFKPLVIAFLLCFGVSMVFSQQSQISFGKNRVQYKDFDWQFYETDNFRIYFYQGGQDMGKYAILSSEKCLQEVNDLLNVKLPEKLDLIVYNDISDMHQTNIGIKEDVESVSGTVQLKNNKLFVYFNGDHSDIDRQIKEGITRIHIGKMSKGSGFQEVIQNSLLLNLPNWFTEGLVQFTGTPWSADMENKLRDGILSGRFSNLSKLSPDEMDLVGHSIWHYLEDQFGKDAVGNLLYLTKVNRSVEDGILFVTGMYQDKFLEQWYYSNLEKFKKEKELYDQVEESNAVPLKKHKAFVKHQGKLSPDGKYLAYTINDIGRWKVFVYNFETKETKALINGGFRTTALETDLSNPMLAWEPKGKKLTVVYEKKDMFNLVHYVVEDDFKKEDKPEPMRKFQKVYDFSYAEDSRNLLLSAMQMSQIDIFKYYMPTNKVIKITNDFYDDLQPSFVKLEGRSGALFISNRPSDELVKGRLDTILPNNNFDVFFYDFNNPVQPFSQLSFTPLANEQYPQAFTDSTYTFLSDASGILAQYEGSLERTKVDDRMKYVYTIEEELGEIDSIVIDQGIDLQGALAKNQTLKAIKSQHVVPVYKMQGANKLYKHYNINIEELSVGKFDKAQIELVSINQKEVFVLNNIDYNYSGSEVNGTYMNKLIEKEEKKRLKKEATQSAKELEAVVEEKKEKVIVYQSKFDGWEQLSEAHKAAWLNKDANLPENSSDEYKFTRTRQYFLKFMTDNISVGLDNSLLVNNYQPFNPNDPNFSQPGLNPMLRFGITDLFEDHKLYGGIRMPLFGNLNPQVNGQALPFKIGIFENMEIFFSYENYKKRWDKSLTFYHKNLSEISPSLDTSPNANPFGVLNTKTNLLETKLTYPFNQLNSLRLKIGFRNDRFITKSTDQFTLNQANRSQNWVYNRVEFVHDHTLSVAKNIMYGFKVNVYYEFQKEFPTREDTILKQQVQVPIFNNSYLMLWGVDARHYQKVYKTIIWANRFAYSTSVGTKKMVYYLGGTEGMLFPNFNETTIVNTDNNYAYQSLAVNMHGFQQNIRNGNSFAVINSEIRIPVFSAFSKRELKSSLLENFQLIGFFDVGTAWEGVSPFGKGNIAQEIRQNSPENPTAVARLDVYKEPVVMGFGIGMRMELMGYFFRADLGWGYDTGKVNKPRFQVALGYDF
ncbi:MAG: hypothetical protein ACI9O4_001070 [Chitinophagales bacterium]|jgi:hypothetical protein